MPVYEYRCNNCSTTFDLLRGMSEREVVAVCPSCESRTTMPMISRVAVHAGAAASGLPEAASTPAPRGGGCCGGGCGCG